MNYVAKNILILAALSFCASELPAADALTTTAQSLLKNHEGAVVQIEAVLDVTMKVNVGGEQKTPTEVAIQGTVIDAAGTVVTSYSNLDRVYLAPYKEQTAQGMLIKIDLFSEINDIRIRYSDGTKVSAKMILKDPELDLAFLVPTTATETKQHLGLTSAARAEVLDQVITLGRSGALAKYEPLLNLSRVQAVLQKPSRRYLMDVTPGTPVFDANGKLIGIGVVRGEPVTAQSKGPKNGNVPMVNMVMPIDEIMSIAKQIKKS